MRVRDATGALLQDAHWMVSQAGFITLGPHKLLTTPSLSGLPLALTQRLASVLEEGAAKLTLRMLQDYTASAALPNASVSSAQAQMVSAGGITMLAAVVPVTVGKDLQPMASLPLAAAVPFSALQVAFQNVSDNSTVVGFTSVRWSGLNPYGGEICNISNSSFFQNSTAIISDVMSLSMFNSRGVPIQLQNLRLPIVVAIPMLDLNQDDIEERLAMGHAPECRWWSDDTSCWASSGCQALGFWNNGKELLCACSHLTTFAAFMAPTDIIGKVMGAVAQYLVVEVVECALAAALFSSEGLTALRSSLWVNRASAASFILLAVILPLWLLISAFWDKRNQKELRELWGQLGHVHDFELGLAIKETMYYLRTPKLWKYFAVRSVIETIAGSKLGICQGTVCVIEEAQQKGPGFNPDHVTGEERSRLSLAATVTKASSLLAEQKMEIVQEFTFEGCPTVEEAGLCKWGCWRVRRCTWLWLRAFAAGHSLRLLVVVDVYTLVIHRSFTLAVQLLGGVFCSAFYFHSSGTNLSIAAPARCQVETLDDRIRTCIPVGVVSMLVATGPSTMIYNMVTARPRSEGQGRVWDRILEVLFFLIGTGLCSFYLLFVAAFLANVDDQAANLWMISALWTLVSSLLVMPLGQAALSVGLACYFLNWEPELRQHMLEPLLDLSALEDGHVTARPRLGRLQNGCDDPAGASVGAGGNFTSILSTAGGNSCGQARDPHLLPGAVGADDDVAESQAGSVPAFIVEIPGSQGASEVAKQGGVLTPLRESVEEEEDDAQPGTVLTVDEVKLFGPFEAHPPCTDGAVTVGASQGSQDPGTLERLDGLLEDASALFQGDEAEHLGDPGSGPEAAPAGAVESTTVKQMDVLLEHAATLFDGEDLETMMEEPAVATVRGGDEAEQSKDLLEEADALMEGLP